MNRKHIILGLFLVCYIPIKAATPVAPTQNNARLIITTSSTKPLFVYVNRVNELRVSSKESKYIELLDPQITNNIIAINELGTLSSDFYTLKLPKDVTELTIQVDVENNQILLKSLTPNVPLTKE